MKLQQPSQLRFALKPYHGLSPTFKIFIFPLLLFLKSSFSSYMITVTLFYQVRANIPEAKKRLEADRNLEHQMIALIPSGLVLVDKLVE